MAFNGCKRDKRVKLIKSTFWSDAVEQDRKKDEEDVNTKTLFRSLTKGLKGICYE